MSSSDTPSSSVKRKLILPMVAASAVLAAVSLAGIYAKSHEQLDRNLRIRSELIADMVNHANQHVYDSTELQRMVTAIGPEHEVSLIVAVGGRPSRVTATTRQEWLGKPLSELPWKDVGEDLEEAIRTRQPRHDFQPESNAFDYTMPLDRRIVGASDDTDGAVMVHLDVRPTEARILRSSLELSALALFGVSMLSLIGYWLLNRVVLKPLEAISNRVKRYRQGDRTQWAETESDDELGALAHTLRGALTNADAALEELDAQAASLVISDERWRLVLRGSTDAAWDWNVETDEVFYSARWVEMLGYGEGDVPPPGAFRQHEIHPDDMERVFRAVDDVLEGKASTYEVELRVKHKDGHYVPILARGVIVRDSVGRPIRVSGTNTDLTERKVAETALRDQEVERARKRQLEGLLREIHHRVKNNLQMISSLLHFQAKKAASPEVARVFRETQDRLHAMTLVHERLHRSAESVIVLDDFLGALAKQLRQSFGDVAGRVSLEVVASPVEVPSAVAVPCGMIVTELVTNSFKYGFPRERRGAITVRLEAKGDRYRLSVTDDGVGLPEGVRFDKPRSFGFELITNLAEQLDGKVEVGPGPGTSIAIDAPIPA